MPFSLAGRYSEIFVNLGGVPRPGLAVSVYLPGTNNLATLYTDRTKSTQAGNPFATDSRGLGTFFADPGDYELLAAADSMRIPVTVPIDPTEAAQDITEGPTAASVLITHKVTGDTQDRFRVKADGTMEWGGGSAATDVSLSRINATVVRLITGFDTFDFSSGGGFRVSNGNNTGGLGLDVSVLGGRLWFNQLGGLEAYGGSAYGNPASGAVAHFRANIPTTIPMILKAAAAQSANAFEYRDSADVVKTSITAAGYLRVGANVLLDSASLTAAGQYFQIDAGGDQLFLTTGGAKAISIKVGGQIELARTLLFGDSAGNNMDTNLYRSAANVLKTDDLFEAPDVRAATYDSGAASGTYLSTLFDTGAVGAVVRSSAHKGFVIKGAASQSANLQEWQNSAGTVLARIASDGSLGVKTSTSGRAAAVKGVLAIHDATDVEAGFFNPDGVGGIQLVAVGARVMQFYTNSQEVARFKDGLAIADTETSLLLRRNVGGALTIQQVSMGAADSGGAGFKVLRVPN